MRNNQGKNQNTNQVNIQQIVNGEQRDAKRIAYIRDINCFHSSFVSYDCNECCGLKLEINFSYANK